MTKPKDLKSEAMRAEVLAKLSILDSVPEKNFDAIVNIAKSVFATKISLISLIDSERQWFKARYGLPLSETSRDLSFCSVAVEADESLFVSDATRDPRFRNNPLVLGEPHIRFYAGIPVRARVARYGAAVPIGTLCVIDDKPREMSDADLVILADLASLVEELVEARALARHAEELAEARLEATARHDRERRQLKQAERMADMGSWRLTLESSRIEWSDGVYAIHDVPLGTIPPLEKALDFYPEPYRGMVAEAVGKTIESGQPFEIEADLVTAKGRKRRVRSIGELELLRGQPVALIGVFQDITDRYHMEQALRHHAWTDELTLLPNRADFNRVFDSQLFRAQVTGEDFAVLLIDLDGFKLVNDTLGHAAGDDVLREVGKRLQGAWLTDSFAARLGGDEFAIIVRSPDSRDEFKAFVDRLLAELRISVARDGTDLSVSGTVGIAWTKGEIVQREEMMRRADSALYVAKRTRKGTAQTFRHDTPVIVAGHEKPAVKYRKSA